MGYFFDSEEIEIRAFEKLGSLPLESDFIILRKKKKDLSEHYPVFKFLMPYLGPITVVEYKSPLDRLTWDDFDLLRVYRLLVKRKYRLKRDDHVWAVSMFSQCERGYAEYVKENGYEYQEIEEGIFGHQGEFERFFWLNLADIGRQDPGSLINLFSSNFREYGRCAQFREDDAEILAYIWQGIFKKELKKMRQAKLRQLPEFTTSMEEIRKRLLEFYKPEEKLAGLKLKDRLAGLNKDQLKKLKKLLESQS